MVIGSISTMSDNFIGWGRGNSSASLASSSHKSQRSRKSLDTRSHRSLDTKSIKSSTSSKRGGESLQDGLERIERKTSQSQSFSVKSHKSSSSRRTSTSKQSRGPQKSVKSSMSRSSGQRSCASVSSVSSRRSSTSKRISSSKSVSSQYSSISNISAMSIHTQQTRGIGYLKSGNYRKAIQLFTKAIQSHHDNGDEEQQSSIATLYGYRSEALYELGAYHASTRDVRNVLQLYNSDNKGDTKQWFGGIFKSSSSSSAQSQKLNHEGGAVLHAKALCTLGYCLLRQGQLDEVLKSFEEAINIANKALGDAIDLPVSDRPVDYEQAVISLKETIQLATEGQSLLSKYECLMTKLDDGSNKREHLQVLDNAIEISPAAIHLHVKKVNYLISRRRWFAVANHCEQLAADATKLDGIFRGDLNDIDPFPTRLQELHSNAFVREEATPVHLRILNPVEVCDAVFRIPVELLPYYLRSLRLEERYKGAMLASKALKDFRDSTNSHADYNFLDNEFDKKLKKTMKLKEEADALFRDKQYAQACIKYGECMSVDDEEVVSILRPASNWPVAFTKTNKEGGKLHAVLHSNRAGCFVALGRHHDAIKESSHAIKIHPMYCKALLRRARSYVIVEQRGKAQEDFNQYIRLVDGARDYPYPPYNQGSSCYFNMPSEVSAKQLQDVKDEMNSLGMQSIKTKREESLTMRKLYPVLACLVESLCCKSSNVKSQVVVARKQTEHRPSPYNDDIRSQHSVTKSRDGSVKNDIVTPTKRDKRRISFSSDSPPVYKYAPDPPTPDEPSVSSSRSHSSRKKQEGLDPSIDYYSILSIAQTATDSEIKRAYHKARQGSHTQDQSDKVEVASILGNRDKREDYDKLF